MCRHPYYKILLTLKTLSKKLLYLNNKNTNETNVNPFIIPLNHAPPFPHQESTIYNVIYIHTHKFLNRITTLNPCPSLRLSGETLPDSVDDFQLHDTRFCIFYQQRTDVLNKFISFCGSKSGSFGDSRLCKVTGK